MRICETRFMFGSKIVRILYCVQYTLQFSQYLNKRARQIKSNTEIVMKHVFQFNEIVFNVICWSFFSTSFFFVYFMYSLRMKLRIENCQCTSFIAKTCRMVELRITSTGLNIQRDVCDKTDLVVYLQWKRMLLDEDFYFSRYGQ